MSASSSTYETENHIRYLSQETLRNPMKSVKIPHGFHAESAKLLCSCPRNCSTTYAECLPFSRNDTSLSAENAVRGFVLTKLTSSCFVERLYCIRIWHTSFTLVATNNNGLITDT